MSDDKLEQKKPTNTGQADYGGARSEETSNEEAPALLNEDKIDALDTENFDAVEYQEDGQGGPRAGLEKEHKTD
ncbi:hypothetical protein [Sphingomicrobium clamense]|uniref:Uncharacterized protein n=1 Tax=Sphingomicrobium clamense TaxID=2851013 RepID=A0ABS6V5A8_9SPHN|nr:hypothetical protein [Sphingomicrobium sp. B8]MBW0144686.1 hypothetical protein [Sphingomicrobium sp. B8]